MNRVYFYAIMPAAPAAPQRAFDVAGLWPADPQVRTITGGALAAVVGASPPVDFRALPREQAVHYLLAHQRVVEAVMRTSAALPVKFGTTLPDEAAVVSLLGRGATLLAPPLAELSQHVQVELVVSWSIDDILRKIAAEDAVVRLKAQVGAQAGGATGAQRLAIGKLVKESIDRRRESYRSWIVTKLRSVATDLIENALMDDRMVANLALLVAKDASEALDHRLAELDEECGKRLNFRCIGPLPPYSFATVEVSLPSFAAIDRARRILSLGERVGLADIKSAYRRQIRQVHPDLSSAVPDDGSPAGRLTDAYKTLMNYAAALPLAAGAAGAGGTDAPGETAYRFDRGTVEGSILVAVRRQELAAAPAQTPS